MSSSFNTGAAALVKNFQNGRQLSEAFNTALIAAQDDKSGLLAKQSALSLLYGNREDTEFTQFSVLYASSLQRLGLAEEGKVTYIKWSALLPDEDKAETANDIAAKLDALFEENKGGVIVIRNAYEGKDSTIEQNLAIRTLEEGLKERMKAHPLVILAGKPGLLKKNLGKSGKKLAFGQRIGL